MSGRSKLPYRPSSRPNTCPSRNVPVRHQDPVSHGFKLVGLVARRAVLLGQHGEFAYVPVLRPKRARQRFDMEPNAAWRVHAHQLEYHGAESARGDILHSHRAGA